MPIEELFTFSEPGQPVNFSDASKALEEVTGIPDIDLFPGLRKWKRAKDAEKLASAIPAEIRGAVVRKLIGSLIAGLFGRK